MTTWDPYLKRAGLPTGRHVYAFNFIRSALTFLFENGSFPHRRVVFPAFICPVVVEAALRAGIEPVLIDVDPTDFHLDLNELQKVDLSKVDAVFLNHTFGFPADIKALREKLKGTAVKIIEDRAHGWFIDTRGEHGDIILCSLYKQIQNSGGGLMIAHEDWSVAYAKLPPSRGGEFAQRLWKVSGVRALVRTIRKRKGLYEPEVPESMQWKVERASPFSEQRFKENFDRLEADVKSRRVALKTLMPDLNAERSSASIVSVVVDGDRDRQMKRLRREGIFLDRMWMNAPAVLPRYQKYLQGECPVSRRVAHGIVNLNFCSEIPVEDTQEVLSRLDSGWNEYVKKSGASVFHLEEWRDIFKNAYGYQPRYDRVYSNGKIEGIFPHFKLKGVSGERWESVPFSDEGGPWSARDDVKERLIKKVKNDLPKDAPLKWFTSVKPRNLPSGFHVSAPFVTFELETTATFEEVLKNTIHQKTRNMVLRAEREGIQANAETAPTVWKEYYPLYSATMRRLYALPQPKVFFKEVATAFPHSVIFTSRKNGKLLAGLWAFVHNGTLTVWSNASTREGANRGANNAVYAAAIRYACDHAEVKRVNFGSTVPGTPHHFFKQRWGGVEKTIYQVSTSVDSGGNAAQKKVMAVLRWCPDFVLQPVARFIYRYY